MARFKTLWAEEDAALVRDLWREGFSAAEIGRKIGKTRNAVVGRVHREKLQARDEKTRKCSARFEKPRRKRPSLLAAVAERAEKFPRPRNVTLLAIKAGECRRVVGEPKGPQTLFCGRPVLAASHSFCPDCARHFFQARPNWEEREAAPRRRTVSR